MPMPEVRHLSPGERVEAVSWIEGVPLESYRTLVFYVNNSVIGAPLSASATDANGNGLSINWTDNAGGWDRISVDIAEGKAESALGNTVSVSVDRNAGEISRFMLIFDDAAAAADGTLYLDEIHFSDPAFTFTGGAEIQGSWRYQEDVAAWGDFPVLGDISIDSRVQVAGGTVLSGLNQGSSVLAGSLSFGADVMGVGLSTDWKQQLGTRSGRLVRGPQPPHTGPQPGSLVRRQLLTGHKR